MDTESTSKNHSLICLFVTDEIIDRLIAEIPNITAENQVLRKVTGLTLVGSLTLTLTLLLMGVFTGVTVAIDQNFILCQTSFVLFRIAEFILIAFLTFTLRTTYGAQPR